MSDLPLIYLIVLLILSLFGAFTGIRWAFDGNPDAALIAFWMVIFSFAVVFAILLSVLELTGVIVL